MGSSTYQRLRPAVLRAGVSLLFATSGCRDRKIKFETKHPCDLIYLIFGILKEQLKRWLRCKNKGRENLRDRNSCDISS